MSTLAPPRTRYASRSITERRRRILAEACDLIGTMGADAFTLRDLAGRAGVSVSTLYNIFGDKEALIAHALRDHHAELTIDVPNHPTDLASHLATLDITTGLMQQNAAYSVALADLYFSRSLAPALFDIVQGFALVGFTPWAEAASASFRQGADIAEAATLFANLEWSAVRDWGAGRLPDAAFAARRKRGFLMVVAGIAVSPLLDEARALLVTLDPAG